MTASLMILISADLVKKKYIMFGSHLIDNIKNKQYTNLKVAVLLQPLKRETKILYNSGIGEKARLTLRTAEAVGFLFLPLLH